MKIVYEDSELDSIRQHRRELQNSGHPLLFDGDDPDRVYGLTFKVTDPELAEYLLVSLLNNRLSDFDLGIDIQSIEFGLLTHKDSVRNQLHKMIDKIVI